MQILPGQIAATLQGSTTYLCRLWTLTLQNGDIYRFTDLTRDVVFGGETYVYDPGIRVSSVVISSGGQPDNAQIEVTTADSFLPLVRIRQGALKNSTFELWAVDWRDPDFYGKIELFSGSTSEVKYNNKGRVDVGVNSDNGAGPSLIGERYSRQCRAKFGDARCKFPIEDHTLAFTVSAVYGDGYKFAATEFIGPGGMSEDDIYQFGAIVWTTGLNATLRDEVKNSRILVDSGEITLSLYPRNPVGLGDTGVAYFGCDFNVFTCQHRYHNAVNYRGEPYVPPPQVTVYAGKPIQSERVFESNIKVLTYADAGN